MLVITRHAEEKLVAFNSKLKQNAVAWRAVYFFQGESQEYANREEVRLQVVVNGVKRILREHDENVDASRLSFFGSGDIVFLCPGATDDTLHAIAQRLEHAFPAETGQPSAAMVLDLSVDFEKYNTMVQQQCLAAQERAEASEKLKEPEKVRQITVDERYAREQLKKRAARDKLMVQLVEDDPFTLQLIETVLQGHMVVRAMDGVDAVETYMLNAPDVVFLDINLPSMNGHEVLDKILTFDPQAFVVMLSGNSFMEDVTKAVKNGAKGFIAKPFPKEKLVNYIQLYETERKKG